VVATRSGYTNEAVRTKCALLLANATTLAVCRLACTLKVLEIAGCWQLTKTGFGDGRTTGMRCVPKADQAGALWGGGMPSRRSAAAALSVSGTSLNRLPDVFQVGRARRQSLSEPQPQTGCQHKCTINLHTLASYEQSSKASACGYVAPGKGGREPMPDLASDWLPISSERVCATYRSPTPTLRSSTCQGSAAGTIERVILRCSWTGC
jgi:hypothetical protein